MMAVFTLSVFWRVASGTQGMKLEVYRMELGREVQRMLQGGTTGHVFSGRAWMDSTSLFIFVCLFYFHFTHGCQVLQDRGA